MVAFLSYETLGLPFVVPFNPIITRIQGLDPLFCSRLTTWPTWILLSFFFFFFSFPLVPPPPPPPPSLLKSHPSIPGLNPTPPSVLCEPNVSPSVPAARPLPCLTCKPFHCLIVWPALQPAKHVDALIAHLGGATPRLSLSLSHTLDRCLALAPSLSPVNNQIILKRGAHGWSRAALNPAPVFNSSMYFIFHLK